MSSFSKALVILTLGFVAFSSNSNRCCADFIFTNESYTSNSLTFTIDGDMSGLIALGTVGQFSIRWEGDIWAGLPGFAPNIWSASVFDNESLQNSGNTGEFGSTVPYSWSSYTGTLADAVATNRTITLTFSEDFLDIDATNPIVEFYWGNGHSGQNQTFLGSVNFVVPEPSSLALLFVCAIGICFRRKNCRRSC